MSTPSKVSGASWLEPAYVPKSTNANLILPFDYNIMSYDISDCVDKRLEERYPREEIQKLLNNIRTLLQNDVVTIRSNTRTTFVLFIIWSLLVVVGAISVNVESTYLFQFGVICLVSALLMLPCWCLKIFHMEKVKKSLLKKIDMFLRRENQQLKLNGIRWKRGGPDYYWLELWMDFKFEKFKRTSNKQKSQTSIDIEEIPQKDIPNIQNSVEQANIQKLAGVHKKDYEMFVEEA